MGQVHGRNAAANPRLDLAFLVEPQPEPAQRLAAELGCRLASLDAVLADPEVAAVIIASSTDTHLELTLAALAAGKAVFCEKPLDLDLQRLRAHAAALRAPGPALYVAFNHRFDPHIRTLKAKLDAGAIGRLETANLISHDPAPPPPAFIPTSGGLFRDFAIHDFDMARWLFGEAPREVFAFGECLFDPDIAAAGDIDTARTMLAFETGRLCVISNTRRSGYGYDQRLELYGAGGALMAGDPRLTTVERWDEDGAHLAPIYPGFVARYAASYRAELDHFADVLEGKAEPLTGYDASFGALALAEAALACVRTGAVAIVEAA
jgi:myo-inositol 2-dehydrogenase/D-chiro-inositol 1-dehydrogenase